MARNIAENKNNVIIQIDSTFVVNPGLFHNDLT